MTTHHRAAVIILLTVLLSSSIDFLHSKLLILALELPAIALFLAAVFFGNVFSRHMALFTLFVPVGLVAWPHAWPFRLLAPLLPYAVIVALTPRLRRSVSWLKKGKFDSTVIILMTVTVAASAAGLAVWFVFLRTNLSMHIARVPSWSPEMLVAAGIVFGFVNAAIEENIFRGLLTECLRSIFASRIPVIAIQAVAFGLIHLKGLPTGVSGVSMAAAFGVLQGVIRLRSGGLLAPYLTHACMDMMIFFVLAFWLR